jgi:hypothetical protein
MNLFDIVSVLGVGSAAARGWRRGLAVEGYRLFRMVVALVAGTSLYGGLSDLLGRVAGIQSSWADPAMFLGVSFGAWSLLRRLRAWSEARLAAALPARTLALGGAVAAGIKALAVVGGAVTVFSLSSWLPGHETVGVDSWMARLLGPWLGSP